MLQTSLKREIKPRFTLRTKLGLISSYAEIAFSKALNHYKQQSGELPMLQPDKQIEDYATKIMPAVKATEQQAAPGLLKFNIGSLSPLLAVEAAIHHHLEKCRSLPAILYVDSRFFLPVLQEQYKRIKFAELKGSYHYWTGHQLVSIVIATEQEIDAWARVALGGSIPPDMIISSMSLVA